MLRISSIFIVVFFLFNCFILHGNTKLIEKYSVYRFDISDGLISNAIDLIIQDKAGYLWVLTKYGITKFDGIKFRFFSKIKKNNFPVEIEKKIIDRYKIKKKFQKEYRKYLKNNHKFDDISIKSILKDLKDIWIGTEGDGVIFRSGTDGSFLKINIPFLDNDFINDIFKDKEGNIWFGTESSGLVRLVKKKKIYPKISFPIIERVVLNNNDITNQQTPIIKSPFNIIEFHFTGIYFKFPDKLRFRYRLNGYDKDWKLIKPGYNRLKIYINLEPGAYSFSLQSGISDKNWSKAISNYKFEIIKDKTNFLKFILITILLLLIFFYIFYRIRSVIKKNNKLEYQKEKYKTSGLNEEFAEKTLTKLLSYMENGTPYLEPALNLKKLSEILHIQYNHLSQIINEKLNQNSNDFINKYRIEEAKKMLSENKKISILDIAYECGFYSKSVFNTAFKKFTGITPSQYKKK